MRSTMRASIALGAFALLAAACGGGAPDAAQDDLGVSHCRQLGQIRCRLTGPEQYCSDSKTDPRNCGSCEPRLRARRGLPGRVRRSLRGRPRLLLRPVHRHQYRRGELRRMRPELPLYRDTFKAHKLDGLVFPTVPKVAMAANAESSSVPTFMSVIQNTDPGSNAGVPGLQVPIALGASSRLPIGLEIDGPAGSDRRLVAIGLSLEALFGRLPAPGR